MHEFSWHGSRHAEGTAVPSTRKASPSNQQSVSGVAESSFGEKFPHELKFHKLRCTPDQMYACIKNVRTTDDAQITINLMIFYELKDVEMMLDSTKDPIGDFINAVSADMVTFGASHTYESFQAATAHLSELAAFPILADRMRQVGFDLVKIVYRGFTASATLQDMHDQAIAKRTRLKLDADTHAMERVQTTKELQCKQERSRAEMDLEDSERRHKNSMLDLEAEQARRARDADHTQVLRHEAEREQASLDAQKARNDEALRFNETLSKLGVDLTAYLTVVGAKEPDHHIKIDGSGVGTNSAVSPALHFEVPSRTAHA